MSFGKFRKCFLPEKKINFFLDIFHMPTKSMRISPKFFLFSRKMENLNYRSDLKMGQIFEILSEFAHSGVWSSWKWKLSKAFKKLRFSAFWTTDLLQKPFLHIWISAAFLRSVANSASEMPKIALFLLRRKIHPLMPKKEATHAFCKKLVQLITFWSDKIEKNFFYKKWTIFVAD